MTTISDIMPRAAAPCPDWCGMPAGHPYGEPAREGEGVSREHVLTVGKWQSPFTETVHSWYAVVEITANAEADADDSPTERSIDRPSISFYVEGDIDDLTPDRARDLAAFLSAALRGGAHRLEQIIEAGDAAPPA
jgi:hypothetical protein